MAPGTAGATAAPASTGRASGRAASRPDCKALVAQAPASREYCGSRGLDARPSAMCWGGGRKRCSASAGPQWPWAARQVAAMCALELSRPRANRTGCLGP
eukprot:8387812-Pyramimonas_sp.AAC.1